MRFTCFLVLSFLLLSFVPRSAYADTIQTINLGSADSFAVLAGSAVTNTGSTIIDGNLGLWPGTSITGFPPGLVNGTIHNSDMVAMHAQHDLTAAFNVAAGMPCGVTLSGNLGGLTLTPGIYCFSSSAQLTGTLTLNALGNSNSFFLFQIGSTLTTASNSTVDFINGGQGDNLFWQVGSSADSWYRHHVPGQYTRAHEYHPGHGRNDCMRQGFGGKRRCDHGFEPRLHRPTRV
jgi:hypothetical protein